MNASVRRWNPEEIAEHVAGGRPVFVDVRADWCVQCGPQERVLIRIAPDFQDDVLIGSIDAATHSDFIEDWDIHSLPTFVLFNHGAHQRTVSGYHRGPELRTLLSNLIAAPAGDQP